MPRNESSATISAGDDESIAGAVQRLDREFRGSVHRGVIVDVVRRSRLELDGPPVDALPELVERLARQRLLQHAGGGLTALCRSARSPLNRFLARPDLEDW